MRESPITFSFPELGPYLSRPEHRAVLNNLVGLRYNKREPSARFNHCCLILFIVDLQGEKEITSEILDDGKQKEICEVCLHMIYFHHIISLLDAIFHFICLHQRKKPIYLFEK